ncbi:MAG: LLM class flavin-dependent oxidoreductase [Methylophilaceae bacterium]
MAIEFFWQVPTSGDGRYADAAKRKRGERDHADSAYFTAGVTDPRGNAYNYFDHLHQIAKAAELAKFDGIQIPNDPQGDESWIVAGYLTRSTKYLTVITEFDASRGSAVYAAKNAVSYQRFSGGQFAWQISTGGDEKQRHHDGDFIDAKDIQTRIEEFLTVSRNVITKTAYSFKGQFFEVLEGGFRGPLSGQKVPTVYLSGHSDETYRLSARLGDVHVLAAQPVEDVTKEVSKLKALAATENRSLDVGLRIDVLARETEEEARFDAQRFIEQSGRHTSAIGGALLWKSLSTNQTGADASLVGNYEQVIQALSDYASAGITHFILGAVPSLEEAYRVGEYILPAVRSNHSGAEQRAA